MDSQSTEDIEKLIEKKLEEKLREKKKTEEKESTRKNQVSRRKFLKMLGLGAGGLALSSSAAGAWSLVQPAGQGTSDVEAETATQGVTNGNSFEVTNSGNTLLSITGGTPGTTTFSTDLVVENASGQEVVQVPVYQSTSDLPNKPQGSLAYVKDEDKLYVEKGT